ncbi:MAG: translation initiation factor IF-6 [Candidatus Thermoplasmatota archaeon]|jgi:translation initiation factor 6|nr:translation initiation factor IF-6 [Candidatus Thermoplasmatota archaeon]MCL5954694.1 translation initiation factor IF-6 [Candidatus Thermoplasmatota archaeon]
MIQKISILRSNFLGVYGRAWEDVVFLPANVEDEVASIISEGLQAPVEKLFIDNSSLVGTFIALNSNGVVVSRNGSDNKFSDLLQGRNILILKDKVNAIGNDVIANDKAAMIHKAFTASSQKKIEDALGVEVVKGAIGGIKTVGSAATLTKKGMLVTPEATEDEMKSLSELFKVPVKEGTANFGNMYVGSSILANSKGVFVGKETTPIEIGRIDDILS